MCIQHNSWRAWISTTTEDKTPLNLRFACSPVISNDLMESRMLRAVLILLWVLRHAKVLLKGIQEGAAVGDILLPVLPVLLVTRKMLRGWDPNLDSLEQQASLCFLSNTGVWLFSVWHNPPLHTEQGRDKLVIYWSVVALSITHWRQ